MRVGCVHIARVAVSYSRTASAKSTQFTLAALFKFIESAIFFKLRTDKQVVHRFFKNIAYFAVHSSAGVNITCRQYRHVTYAAVTAVIYNIGIVVFGQFENTLLI